MNIQEDIVYVRQFFRDLLDGKTIYGTTAQQTFERIAVVVDRLFGAADEILEKIRKKNASHLHKPE